MKKSAHSTLLFFFLFFSCSIPVNAQATESTAINKLKDFAKHFSIFANEYPQEKVYLHFDNSSYFLGENCWFKAYVVKADRNSLSEMSKILYVELVSAEGYVMDTKKLKIENGQCHSNFFFPLSNYGGYYEIRAYTRYMMNFGDKNYFSRVFPVYDAPKNGGEYKLLTTNRPNTKQIPLKRPPYLQKRKLEIAFYPEGGNLVTGLNSKVAFKATASNGENVLVSGSVFKDKGEKVADFSSEYLGMGSFEFTPENGNYFAKAIYDGKEYEFQLPAALPSGCVMTTDYQPNEMIDILIEKNQPTLSQTLGLSISCRGLLYGFEIIHLEIDKATSLSLPTKMLPSGISQLTLFNTSGEVLSERLVFVNHHDEMKIRVSQNKERYAPFEQATFNFDLKDARENPVETTFSVSIQDATTSSILPLADNALTNLLLSSELKGYIEHPQYYFESDNVGRKKALDLLLLTQGWRRYEWKQMAGVELFNVKQYMDKQLTIDGTVTSLNLKKKASNIDVSILLLSDFTSQQGICKTDSAGTFNFGLEDFFGTSKLIIQSKNKDKRKEMNILMNRQFSPNFKSYSVAEMNVPQKFKTISDSIRTLNSATIGENDSLDYLLGADNENLSMDKKQHLLKEVVVRHKRVAIKVNLSYNATEEMDKIIDTDDWQPTNVDELLGKLTDDYAKNNNRFKGKRVIYLRDNSKGVTTGTSSASAGESSTSGNTNSSQQTISSMSTPSISNLVNPGNSDVNAVADPTDESVRKFIDLPDIDEIESISIIEDHNSILRLVNDEMVNPSKVVVVLLKLKKLYVKEPIGVRNTTFKGYSYVKEFFNPVYDKAVLPIVNDFRRTLYWNPDVKSDKEGKATINFYNNSSCKVMNVSAETVTAKGMIGSYNN